MGIQVRSKLYRHLLAGQVGQICSISGVWAVASHSVSGQGITRFGQQQMGLGGPSAAGGAKKDLASIISRSALGQALL